MEYTNSQMATAIYDLTERSVGVSGSVAVSAPTYAAKDDLVQFNSAIEQIKADIIQEMQG